MTYRVENSDCIEAIRAMPEASIDAIVTDPPYELGFMGKRWDSTGIAYSVDLWREALRVLKPGGHLCAFGGTRTYHRMACAIEDAGFEIRDSLHWIYGSGFPKSLDVSKAIDRHLGAVPVVVGPHATNRCPGGEWCRCSGEERAQAGATRRPPATAPATAWDGWGTALKPAHEPVVLARKPLDGTIAANVMEHGTGAVNVEACRVPGVPGNKTDSIVPVYSRSMSGSKRTLGATYAADVKAGEIAGRWPPNVLLSPEAAEEMDRQSGEGISRVAPRGGTSPNPMSWQGTRTDGDSLAGHSDAGGASRFFPIFRYVAKPARGERDAGLCDVEERSGGDATGREDGSAGLSSPRAGAGRNGGARNHHPTVKPIALMEWLVRLITPPGGTVLDPFLGSGTTGCAAVRCGFNFVGIEREAEYVEIATRRIDLAANAPRAASLGSLSRDDGSLPGQVSLFDLAPLRAAEEGG